MSMGVVRQMVKRILNLKTLCILLLMFAGFSANVQNETKKGDPLVGLTVVPFGEQTFDIATGLTTLPQGGEITDRVSGVVITAPFIELQQGVFIKAKTVEASGEFGIFQASEFYIDFESSVIRAGGEVTLSKDATTIHSEQLSYFVDTKILRLSGGVVGQSPAIEAEAIILEFSSGIALLVGPYTFTDGVFTLSSKIANSLLELVAVENEGSSIFEAATEVDPVSLARFQEYLP